MSEQNERKYPYAKLAHEEIQSEYGMENDRENKISSKSSTFITVIVAIITLYIPLIPFDKLKGYFAAGLGIGEKISTIISLVLLGAGLVSFAISFYYFVKAYAVKGYNRVDVDDLLDLSSKDTEAITEDHVYQGLVAHYHKILRGTLDQPGNMKINSERSEANRKGIKWTVVGFAIISVATIALRIMVV